MARARLLALALALGLPAVPAAAAPARDGGHEDGRRLYNSRCYYCHGYAGDAATLAARVLSPPPRNFSATAATALPREAMLDAVRSGRPGTAMQGFAGLLTEAEIERVVDFVRAEMLDRAARNIRYHSPVNGWTGAPDNSPAAPFVTGRVALDAPWEALSEAERRGKRLYLAACVSCHDRARIDTDEPVWRSEALSYPRGAYTHKGPVDASTGATRFAVHDAAPALPDLSPEERRGEALFQQNCAFCHGADGTGRNWIGSFLAARPRDLSDPGAMPGMTPERLADVIRGGLPGTSMPAWRDVLDEHQIEAVAAYVWRAFQSPGETRKAEAPASQSGR